MPRWWVHRQEFKVLPHGRGGFELAHLRHAANQWSRFLYLKDSVTILNDAAFWSTIDNHVGPAWLAPWPGMYLGIYDSAQLLAVLGDAEAVTKADSLRWEADLHTHLAWPVLWPEASDANAKRIDMIDGLPELVIGNDIWEKTKGTVHWCGSCAGCQSSPGICQLHLNKFGVTL